MKLSSHLVVETNVFLIFIISFAAILSAKGDCLYRFTFASWTTSVNLSREWELVNIFRDL